MMNLSWRQIMIWVVTITLLIILALAFQRALTVNVR